MTGSSPNDGSPAPRQALTTTPTWARLPNSSARHTATSPATTAGRPPNDDHRPPTMYGRV